MDDGKPSQNGCPHHGPRRTRVPRGRNAAFSALTRLLVVVLAVALSACTSEDDSSPGSAGAGGSPSDPASTTTPTTTPTSEERLDLVTLGDSLPTTCETGCATYPTLYADAISENTGTEVRLTDLAAVQLSNVPVANAATLLDRVLTEEDLRTALADAEIVLISIGFNDTAWNRADNPCDAAPRYPVVEWDKITPSCNARVTGDYKRSLDQLLTQIDHLRGCGAAPGVPPCSARGHEDTLLVVVSDYNATIGNKVDPSWDSPQAIAPTVQGNNLLVHAQCEVVQFHGGMCADIYHVFNGARGRQPAGPYLADDYTHLNEHGHKVTAQIIEDLGLGPLDK